MKSFRLFSFFILFSNLVFAQGRMNNWCFGDSARLTFDNVIPTPSTCSLKSGEGCASISDLQGNLLFYSNGITVWNRNNEVMPNGTGLLGGTPGIEWSSSTTQSSLILPFNSDTNKFFLFTLYDGSIDTGLHYSIIDMTLDAGLGNVAQKNILMYHGHLQEKLCAVKHGNGAYWWLFVHKNNSNEFLRFLISNNQISFVDSQAIGSVYYPWPGQMSISQNGDKLACVTTYSNSINLFSLDRCTGLLSNFIDLSDSTMNYSYGCSFSPNGLILYVSVVQNDYPFSLTKLFQYDLSSNDIPSSRLLLYELPYSYEYWFHSFGQMAIGKDDKIYITMGINDITSDIFDSLNQHISVINNPDIVGVGCNFQVDAISLGPRRCLLGLPNFPNYNLEALEGSACDTLATSVNSIASSQTSFQLYPNPFTTHLQLHYTLTQPGDLMVYDALGRKVKSCALPSHQKTFELSVAELPAGVYLVAVNSGGLVWEEVVVKE